MAICMATQKPENLKSVIGTISYYTCDLCDSEEIIETHEGYVCQGCGVVLEAQKLRYDRPYNNDLVHHARHLGLTQIGTKNERLNSIHSSEFNRLHKYNTRVKYRKEIDIKATDEISAIFGALNLPRTFQTPILQKFKEIYSGFKWKSIYRNVEKLVPVVIYYYLKFNNIICSEIELLEVSQITKKEFGHFKLQVKSYFPNHTKIKRQEFISQKLLLVKEHFGLDMVFYHFARKIMCKLWDSIQNTKDDVIAGLCSGIAVLCSYKGVVTVNEICKRLGIGMSTIHAQVKKNVFTRLKIKGYTSLVESAELLRKVVIKLGLLKREEQLEEELTSPDIIEIKLGNGRAVYNSHRNIDQYFFALKEKRGSIVLINLEIYRPYWTLEPGEQSGLQEIPLFDCTFNTLYHNKGPPSYEMTA